MAVSTASSNSIGPGMSNVGCEAWEDISAVLVVVDVAGGAGGAGGVAEVDMSDRVARCPWTSARRGFAVGANSVKDGRGIRGGEAREDQ